MAVPSGLVKFVLYGDATDGEIWSTSWYTKPQAGISSQANLDNFINTYANTSYPAATLSTVLKSRMSVTTRQLGFKGYYYNGGTSAIYATDKPFSSPIVGSSGGSPLPLQTAVVATLLTGASGRRNRGRMYLPVNAVSLSTAHELTTTDVDALANAVKDWFAVLNASGDNPVQVVSVAGSASRPVTQVRVDSKPDIQRRRANKQQPGYQKVATL